MRCYNSLQGELNDLSFCWQSLTASETEFTNNMESDKADLESTAELFINIYDTDGDVSTSHFSRAAFKKLSRAKSLKKEIEYLEIDDGTDCGGIELSGDIQASSNWIILK